MTGPETANADRAEAATKRLAEITGRYDRRSRESYESIARAVIAAADRDRGVS